MYANGLACGQLCIVVLFCSLFIISLLLRSGIKFTGQLKFRVFVMQQDDKAEHFIPFWNRKATQNKITLQVFDYNYLNSELFFVRSQ